GDCRSPLRDSVLPTYVRFGRHSVGLGASLSQRRLRSSRSSAAPGPRAIPHHHAATRRPHRTPQTREPAPYRDYLAARTGAVVRTGRTRGLRRHAVPFPQTARPDGTAVVGRAGAQEVRSRTEQPDLAVRRALWALRPAPRRRQDASLPARHPG